MFLKNKRNYHETIYDSAIGITETFYDNPVDMKIRLVDFLKEAKNRVNAWSFWRNAIAC